MRQEQLAHGPVGIREARHRPGPADAETQGAAIGRGDVRSQGMEHVVGKAVHQVVGRAHQLGLAHQVFHGEDLVGLQVVEGHGIVVIAEIEHLAIRIALALDIPGNDHRRQVGFVPGAQDQGHVVGLEQIAHQPQGMPQAPGIERRLVHVVDDPVVLGHAQPHVGHYLVSPCIGIHSHFLTGGQLRRAGGAASFAQESLAQKARDRAMRALARTARTLTSVPRAPGASACRRRPAPAAVPG
ncbi:hypothetical protein D3C76_841590 [compost metagenome]